MLWRRSYQRLQALQSICAGCVCNVLVYFRTFSSVLHVFTWSTDFEDCASTQVTTCRACHCGPDISARRADTYPQISGFMLSTKYVRGMAILTEDFCTLISVDHLQASWYSANDNNKAAVLDFVCKAKVFEKTGTKYATTLRIFKMRRPFCGHSALWEAIPSTWPIHCYGVSAAA